MVHPTSKDAAGDSVARPSLLLGHREHRRRRVVEALGTGFLLLVTSLSLFALLFIFYFIARDAVPFFRAEGFREFFTGTRWYPSSADAEFGALPLFAGSAMVTLGAIAVAVPLGVTAAVCLSDVLPFGFRQWVKPIVEMLAAIPSVAYGFFALVVFAPLMQEKGGALLSALVWIIGLPLSALAVAVLSDLASSGPSRHGRRARRWVLAGLMGAGAWAGLRVAAAAMGSLRISSGTNALNVSVILGLMALPTIVSVCEDALQAVGRDLREGSYALGATRAETLIKTVLPAAGSGILAAVILGVMRAVGETMVVWMASGNAAQVPQPWWNLLSPVRTLTATIAGDMGEADHVTGSSRYHVLFALALCLLAVSFFCNLASERIIRRAQRKARRTA